MNDTIKDTDKYGNFLKEQIASNKRSTKATWIVGLILVFLLVCYMSGLVYLVHGILEPTTAARMITQSVEGNMPAMMNNLELSVKEQAVPLANACSKTMMAYLPLLRREAEHQIELTYQQWLPLLREEIRSTVRCYVVEHQDELKDIYSTQKGPGFAKAFIDEMTSQITADLNRRLCEEQSGHDLSYVAAVSLNAIKDVDEELSTLLKMNAKDMTRSERLQRRLIVSWTHAIDELLRNQRLGVTGTLE